MTSNFKTDLLDLRLCDNMELMAQYPDKYFDLAIVDPPYGIKAVQRMYEGRGGYQRPGKKSCKKSSHKIKEWDNERPTLEYFNELRRVSKNQIIWGGNYFADLLPVSRGWIFWDKDVYGDCSKGELAWTSFDMALAKVLYVWDGMRQGKGVGLRTVKGGNRATGNSENLETRQHPTQKPIPLYQWLLHTYAKEGDKILDTHLGSMSIAIACHDYGFHLTGCELDPDYFADGVKRVNSHIKQLSLF